ncbi:MAG: translation initiation factor IF-6 [archaeon]
MRLKKASIFNSPFLGVYSVCNNDYTIVSSRIVEKEEKILKEYLDTKIIKLQIGLSSLIGVFLLGVKDHFVVDENVIEKREVEILEKEGLKIKLIKSEFNALGNLIAINSHYGIASPIVPDKVIKEISSFLKIEIKKEAISGIELPGSSIYVNDNLFVVNPNISEKDFLNLKRNFKVPGIATTLNYGDVFVGNDIIANNSALLTGSTTSNIELIKLDELVVEFDNK